MVLGSALFLALNVLCWCPAVLPVPVVLLVVEGGLNTLRTASEAIDKNTPVVIIEGFGRAADLVAAASRLK